MQLIALAATAALSATASAYTGVKSNYYNETCNGNKPNARIVNNCPYTVYAWTVDSDDSKYDCKFHDGLELQQGGFYWENFRPATQGAISIKIGKEDRCNEDGHILQLEYNVATDPINFHDISYVNCQSKDCPTAGKGEGFTMRSGNDGTGRFVDTSKDGSVCPIIECDSFQSCAKHAYVLPDDVQTKSCSVKANIDLYLCGEKPGNSPAPQGPGEYKPSPSKPEEQEEEKKPYGVPPAPVQESYPQAPAITPAPQPAQEVQVKTIVEYTTVNVNAPYQRRHAHRNFHA